MIGRLIECGMYARSRELSGERFSACGDLTVARIGPATRSSFGSYWIIPSRPRWEFADYAKPESEHDLQSCCYNGIAGNPGLRCRWRRWVIQLLNYIPRNPILPSFIKSSRSSLPPNHVVGLETQLLCHAQSCPRSSISKECSSVFLTSTTAYRLSNPDGDRMGEPNRSEQGLLARDPCSPSGACKDDFFSGLLRVV